MRTSETANRLGTTKALPPKVYALRTPSISRLFSSSRTPFTEKLSDEFDPKPGSTTTGMETPGSNDINCVKTRFVRGKEFTCCPVIVFPSFAVTVFTTGGASVTVICSERAPTCRTTFTWAGSAACTAKAECTTFLKPSLSAVSSYDPAGTVGKRNSPDWSVAVLYVR